MSRTPPLDPSMTKCWASSWSTKVGGPSWQGTVGTAEAVIWTVSEAVTDLLTTSVVVTVRSVVMACVDPMDIVALCVRVTVGLMVTVTVVDGVGAVVVKGSTPMQEHALAY